MLKFIPFIDIWEVKADAVVIPVNCVGIMGAGLAHQCRQKYPAAYYEYLDKCNNGKLRFGRLSWHQRGSEHGLLCLLPTKDHFLHDSTVPQIKLGLMTLAEHLKRPSYIERIKTVAIPALGCGCGKLKWSDVKPLFSELADSAQEIIVIEPKCS